MFPCPRMPRLEVAIVTAAAAALKKIGNDVTICVRVIVPRFSCLIGARHDNVFTDEMPRFQIGYISCFSSVPADITKFATTPKIILASNSHTLKRYV